MKAILMSKAKKKLNQNAELREYAKYVDKLYSDVRVVPQFKDEDILIEEYGIEFFHKETQDEILWTATVMLMKLIEHTGCEMSDLISDSELLQYVKLAEARYMGLEGLAVQDLSTGIITQLLDK